MLHTENFTQQVIIIIIRFLINVLVQGATSTSVGRVGDSWLAACMADLTPNLQVSLSWGLIVERFHSLQCLSVSCFYVILGPQAHAFPQPVCERLSWLHHWSIPHVHTSKVFSPSEWGPDPQCQAVQVAHWTWWWQCLATWHCRSVWSLPCHSAADSGGLALSMAMSHWHGAWRSAHKSCTHGYVSWKRGGVKRELVAAPWTSFRRFSHVFWLTVHSHLLLRACLLGSKRKLPFPACQIWPGFTSMVLNNKCCTFYLYCRAQER